jgi:hypothetical protein
MYFFYLCFYFKYDINVLCSFAKKRKISGGFRIFSKIDLRRKKTLGGLRIFSKILKKNKNFKRFTT